MRYITVIAFAFACLNASAQKHVIGIRGGVNYANFDTKTTHTIDGKFYPRAIGGITYDYFMGENMSLGADLLYNQRGRLTELTLTDEMGNQIGQVDLQHQFDYIIVPIRISYKTSGKIYAHASIASLPSYLNKVTEISASFTSNGGIAYPGHKNVNTEQYNRFSFGGMLEVGGGYNITSNLSANLILGFQRGIGTKAKATEYADAVEIEHIGWMASLGVKYALGNKK